MTPDPYAVPPDAPLDEVAATMAARKYGSAVVVDGGSVVGLFTTTDALRALAWATRRRRTHAPGSSLRAGPAGSPKETDR